MQLTLLAELLHGRCTGDIEVNPTDLRRTSATGHVCTLTVVAGGGAPVELKGEPKTFPRAGLSNPKLTISKSNTDR